MCRYWGEDDIGPKTNLTLEGLHRLVEHRAKERANASKKRQLEGDGPLNGCMGTDEAVALKPPGSKKRKKRDKLEIDHEQSDPLCSDLGSEKSAKSKKKAKFTSNDASDDQLSCSGRLNFGELSSEEREEKMEEMAIRNNKERKLLKQGTEEGSEPEKGSVPADVMENTSVDEPDPGEEAIPSLAPLSHGKAQRAGAGKKTVHRQLPEWIVHFHAVENDIERCSR